MTQGKNIKKTKKKTKKLKPGKLLKAKKKGTVSLLSKSATDAEIAEFLRIMND